MVFFIFIQVSIDSSASKQWDADKTPLSAEYGLGLHLCTSHKTFTRLKCGLTWQLTGASLFLTCENQCVFMSVT